nr:hypothetical protein CFP56_69096 [Quercus suber]
MSKGENILHSPQFRCPRLRRERSTMKILRTCHSATHDQNRTTGRPQQERNSAVAQRPSSKENSLPRSVPRKITLFRRQYFMPPLIHAPSVYLTYSRQGDHREKQKHRR